MAGYLVSVCDLCRFQVECPASLLRFTVPTSRDPNTGRPCSGYTGHDYTVEICLRCVQTRFISRLVEAAIAKTTPPEFDAEPRAARAADGCNPVPGDVSLPRRAD